METKISKKHLVNKSDYNDYNMQLFDSIKQVETAWISRINDDGISFLEIKFFIIINKMEYIADVLAHYDLIKTLQKQRIKIEIEWV